ncbi:hypothetical protein Tco_0011335 [Tanacetum coccineum]
MLGFIHPGNSQRIRNLPGLQVFCGNLVKDDARKMFIHQKYELDRVIGRFEHFNLPFDYAIFVCLRFACSDPGLEERGLVKLEMINLGRSHEVDSDEIGL